MARRRSNMYHVEIDGVVVYRYQCSNMNEPQIIDYLKKLYGLKNKNYVIYKIYPSRVNNKIRYEKD